MTSQHLVKTATVVLSISALAGAAGVASAQTTVECRSHNYEYTECQAPLEEPQLIHQISNSSCIINRTWGFNPATKRIWVAEGCAGVFADPQGYHHGRGDTYDANARHYDERGHDSGGVVAGLVVAALIGAALEDDAKDRKSYTTSNDYYSHPQHKRNRHRTDDVDTTPHFDREGNPNFDTQGRYMGCHGVGCLVDDPGS